jgi:hypothetical protein
MRSQEGADREPSRHARLKVEPLESRGLLSVVPIFMAREHGVSRGVPALLSSQQAPDGATSASVPTPHELRREHYSAKAAGPFVTGPGRYTDQALQVSISAFGGSTHSFHVGINLRYFVPRDPARPITGVAAIIPRNASTSGSTLVLDLRAEPTGALSALPSHFTWTVDSSSGGIYTSAGTFGTGQGTLDIHYVSGGRRPGRAFSSGKAFLVLNGLVNADGIFNVLGGQGDGSGSP